MTRARWRSVLPGLSLALLLAAGCRSMRAPVATPQTIEVTHTLGVVVRVNAAHAYAVVRCASLPFDGEEATVYRDDRIAGRLRFTGPAKPPFAVADVVDGAPEAGDSVRVTRTKNVVSTDGGVP